MPLTETAQEAERIMTICNACRYCEGHCAVFPAMALRLEFEQNDLDYLANLCHDCSACYHHCQDAEPHEFAVNVPETFAKLRRETYAENAWPGFMGAAFTKNGIWVTAILLLSLLGFTVGAALVSGADQLFSAHDNKFMAWCPIR